MRSVAVHFIRCTGFTGQGNFNGIILCRFHVNDGELQNNRGHLTAFYKNIPGSLPGYYLRHATGNAGHEIPTTGIRFFIHTPQGVPKGDWCRCIVRTGNGHKNAANDRVSMNSVVCMTVNYRKRNRINQAISEKKIAVIPGWTLAHKRNGRSDTITPHDRTRIALS